MHYIGSAQSGKQTNMCTWGGRGLCGDAWGGWVIITANPVSMDSFSVCSLRKQSSSYGERLFDPGRRGRVLLKRGEPVLP